VVVEQRKKPHTPSPSSTDAQTTVLSSARGLALPGGKAPAGS